MKNHVADSFPANKPLGQSNNKAQRVDEGPAPVGAALARVVKTLGESLREDAKTHTLR